MNLSSALTSRCFHWQWQGRSLARAAIDFANFAPNFSTRRSHMKTAASNKIQQLASWIRGIDFAMLTTEDRTGHLRSRPMVALDDMADDALWFFSDASCHKVDDIQGHHSVNVSYTDPANGKFISVTGRARVVRERALMREMWSSKLTPWFPKGADDPELVLLRIEVFEAEIWQSAEPQTEVKFEVSRDSRRTHEHLTFA
jgi:general stress protein 26